MKFLATVETVGLMLLTLAANVVDGMCPNILIDKPILIFDRAHSYLWRQSW